ncbi:MAG: hypothetical protein IKR11_05390 [Solobacterium sp.]|nr:hypothetical protein [Solobacterium sp.]
MKLFKKIFHKKEEEEPESVSVETEEEKEEMPEPVSFEMDGVTEEMPESRYTEEYKEFVENKLEQEEETDIDPFADLAAMEDDETE